MQHMLRFVIIIKAKKFTCFIALYQSRRISPTANPYAKTPPICLSGQKLNLEFKIGAVPWCMQISTLRWTLFDPNTALLCCSVGWGSPERQKISLLSDGDVFLS